MPSKIVTKNGAHIFRFGWALDYSDPLWRPAVASFELPSILTRYKKDIVDFPLGAALRELSVAERRNRPEAAEPKAMADFPLIAIHFLWHSTRLRPRKAGGLIAFGAYTGHETW